MTPCAEVRGGRVPDRMPHARNRQVCDGAASSRITLQHTPHVVLDVADEAVVVVHLVGEAREQCSREVALAERWDDDDDRLAFELLFAGEADGGRGSGTAGDPGEDAFFTRKAAMKAAIKGCDISPRMMRRMMCSISS